MIDPYQSSEKGSEAQLQMLMALLADVTDKMIVIADELRSKPAVKTATRGCDIRKYRGEFRFGGKGFYDFEAYVEAEMPDGSLVCWLVDINCTPSGWELHRDVSRAGNSSDDVVTTFPVVCSPTFPEFVRQVTDAMPEFVESARSYEFP